MSGLLALFPLHTAALPFALLTLGKARCHPALSLMVPPALLPLTLDLPLPLPNPRPPPFLPPLWSSPPSRTLPRDASRCHCFYCPYSRGRLIAPPLPQTMMLLPPPTPPPTAAALPPPFLWTLPLTLPLPIPLPLL